MTTTSATITDSLGTIIAAPDHIEYPWDQYSDDARCTIDGTTDLVDLAGMTVVFS